VAQRASYSADRLRANREDFPGTIDTFAWEVLPHTTT